MIEFLTESICTTCFNHQGERDSYYHHPFDSMGKVKKVKKLSESNGKVKKLNESKGKVKKLNESNGKVKTKINQKKEIKKKELVNREPSIDSLKRKRERNRLRKLRKRQFKRDEIMVSTKAKDGAIEYLKSWKTDKTKWKFMKLHQSWLLKYIFKTAIITDTEFNLLVEYLKSTKGKARQQPLEQAQGIIKDTDEKWNSFDEKDDNDVQVYNRARKVVQSL